MIQMQKFYTDMNQPAESLNGDYRKLKRVRKAELAEILIIRSQLYWERWTE